MRIIAGENRGRRLEAPLDRTMRPTSDKVKEAMFSILAPEIYDAEVCDLFSGTGSLGLEALSRGAKHCYFGDVSRESIRITEENIERCKSKERSTVIFGDYRRVLDRIEDPVDIFILDPPYEAGLVTCAMEVISEEKLLAEGGTIVAEHHKREELPEELFGFRRVKEKKYGTVVLSFYM